MSSKPLQQTMFTSSLFLSFIIYHTNACHSSCETYLSNDDFDEGTFRITNSGIYCLTENIIFNPHPSPISNPNADFGWFPFNEYKYKGCDSLTGGPYSLGYFAAITIETDDVEVNLCTFSISQSLHFNIQQRWFNIIEIGKAPFEMGQGPTDFGGLQSVQNIYIHNGKLGLSSHNGIHSNSARNVRLSNLKVFSFEVCGIQLNGASGIKMENIEIGPSNHHVLPTAYYSNAKFLSLAMYKLLQAMDDDPSITYSNGRTLRLRQVYDNLITSMDIAFRYFIKSNTQSDIESDLYGVSLELYHNKFGLPDGSALYGILLNSYGWAIFGLGQERNDNGDGQDITIRNVKIRDLKLHSNEVPSIYFDECIDANTEDKTFIKGPFGDTMDIRHMVQREGKQIIDNGGDITALKYHGNPLDDARIALALFGGEYGLQYGSVGLNNKHFFAWALDEYEELSLNTLPSCASFICNADIMFHHSKGIMGFRADLIDDLEIHDLEIRKLVNKSPLNSFACGPYDGPHDGGHPAQMEGTGGLSTSVKGMCVFGGDVVFVGTNSIANMKSTHGDVVGIHLFDDALVLFDDEATMRVDMDKMESCRALDTQQIAQMIKHGSYPYPNDCFVCNIVMEKQDLMQPNPPHGVDQVYCKDVNDQVVHLPLPRTIYEPRKKKVYSNVHVEDEKYRNLNWDPQYRSNHN
eukprot:454915_1